jgi:predicted nuclease of predicted toxin-antitoxin system
VRFCADECCDEGLVAALRADQHDVLYIAESMRGASDEEVLARAHREKRVLLTEDKDFGELVYRLQLPAHGIVLLRFDRRGRVRKVPRLRALVSYHGERLVGMFVTLEADKVRSRALRQ